MDSQTTARSKTVMTNKHKATSIYDYGRTARLDENQDLQVLQRMRRFLLPSDYTIKPERLDQIANGYEITDAVVDAIIKKHGRFADALQQSIVDKAGFEASDRAHLLDDPDFQQLREQFATHPDWFDAKLAEKGAIAYRRYPLTLVWLLRNVALMAGYSIPALSLPLIKTGALVHDALPRLYRTYGYMMAVSEHPKITGDDTVLAIGGEAWRQTIRVRQLHSMIRKGLVKEGFDTQYWAQPINQSDMIATHLQFSLLISQGLKWLGARISEEEARGIMHLWRLATWWMGVDLARIPNTEQESWGWFYHYLSVQKLDFEVGRPLAKALHDLPSQIMGETNWRGHAVELVNASVTRTFVGDDVGDGLKLPKLPLRQGVLLTAPILFGIDTARQLHPKLEKRIERFRRTRQDNMNWWLKKNDPYYANKKTL
ncbi:oxygenase MpaB family protein [Psychrobacter sp. FDAARGOS_221]|uniref:oxygenase MpaB family protein n=1 Tax=Psychrobacter sp. FDAARGOS_221 TaxID=1975705 RepID=UPI002228550E|nr:oxygenase MpaB family protein [Psychrobacter sp. FDAARGOS_221]